MGIWGFFDTITLNIVEGDSDIYYEAEVAGASADEQSVAIRSYIWRK